MLVPTIDQPSSSKSVSPPLSKQYEHPWRVIRCESGREFDVESHLQSRSVPAFLPTFQLTRRWSRRQPEIVTRALFPGYVFASFDPIHMGLVITVPRVFGLLRFGLREAIVEPEEMDRIQVIAAQSNVEPWEGIPDGAPVRIVEGPLQGVTGRLIGRRGANQVAVEVEMLNRIVKISVDGWRIVRV